MALYILKRADHNYDEFDELLVRATNEQHARNIAHGFVKYRECDWSDASTKVKIVQPTGEYGVVMSSFRAG